VFTPLTAVQFESVGSTVTPSWECGVGGGEEDVLLQAALRRNGRRKTAIIMSPALTMVTAAGRCGALSTLEKRKR